MPTIDQGLKTRDKILAEALEQFNARGVNAVTIRSLAGSLGISPGNLTYHFKNTDVIVQELYLELVGQINRRLVELQEQTLTFEVLYDQVRHTMGLFYHYRFIMLDFAHIARRVPYVGQHFRNLVVQRQQEFRYFYRLLIEAGIFKPEPTPGQYDRLIYLSIIFGNSWLSDAAIHFGPKADPDAMLDFYTDLQLSQLVPYLTPEGLAAYQAVMGTGQSSGYPKGRGEE